MKVITKRLFSTLQAGKKPYSVLFFGSDEYSRLTLTSMMHNKKYPEIIKRLAVASPGVGDAGSASDLFHKFLKESKIEKYTFRVQFAPLEKYIAEQESKYEYPFDLAVIASFPKRVPESILNLFPEGVLVAHPSLLPKYRGESAIEHSIMNSEKEGGVTILEASKEKHSSGKILLQQKCNIDPDGGYMQLATKYGELAGEALVNVIDDIEGFIAKGIDQVVSEKDIRAPLINKEQAIFLWDQLTVEKAIRKQLALLGSSMPGFTKLKLKNEWHYVHFDQLKPENKFTEYYRKILEPVDAKSTPGVIHWSKRGNRDKICIRCTDGWVSTDRIKIDKSKATTTVSFITNQLRDEHFNENNRFVHKFANSNDIIKLEAKVNI